MLATTSQDMTPRTQHQATDSGEAIVEQHGYGESNVQLDVTYILFKFQSSTEYLVVGAFEFRGNEHQPPLMPSITSLVSPHDLRPSTNTP